MLAVMGCVCYDSNNEALAHTTVTRTIADTSSTQAVIDDMLITAKNRLRSGWRAFTPDESNIAVLSFSILPDEIGE